MLILEIDCIKREGNLITEISGKVRAQSSDEPPTHQTIKAIDQPWDVHWIHPTHGNVLIKHVTMNDTKCFIAENPVDRRHNLLADLQDCV